jgi:hypothetical protein
LFGTVVQELLVVCEIEESHGNVVEALEVRFEVLYSISVFSSSKTNSVCPEGLRLPIGDHRRAEDQKLRKEKEARCKYCSAR